MLGYNMFAYCNNNPVNYVDYTGESALSLLTAWLTGSGTVAIAEPTLIGEAVVATGAVIIGSVYLSQIIVSMFEDYEQSLGEGESNSDDVPNIDDDADSLPQQRKVISVPDAPPVEAAKQGKHVKGHKNYDPQKSQWNPGENGVRQTQEAWKNSTPHPKKPNTRIGVSNDGRTIEIKYGKNGIHGYPVFP